MRRDIFRFAHGQYDCLVIGGGINGAAIAHMAALNGLKVALLEKDDFASGTSSKTTKLIHGGLRYLENFELDLVTEALRERFYLLRDAPHLVRSLSFIIPLYKTDARPWWLVRLGVWLYDQFAGRYTIGHHRLLAPDVLQQLMPGLKAEGLRGGILYYDAQMDDARLVLENVLSAEAFGAHAANYVEVKSFLKKDGLVTGVIACDTIGSKEFELYARTVVCAVGPWTNRVILKEQESALSSCETSLGRRPSRPLVRTTKGAHVVCQGQISSHALIIPTSRDQRVLFVIPWMGNSLVGTTDTDYTADPDRVATDQEDIDYLFQELRRVFPSAADGMFKKEKIIATFAGLRPLAHQPGVSAKVSRQHLIRESDSGVVYVVGGKYTTYRKIAQDCLKKIMPSRSLVDTRNGFPVFGSGKIGESAQVAAEQYGLEIATIQYLMDFYGTRYKDVLALVRADPTLKEPLCTCSLAIKAQAVYAIQSEMAITQDDLIKRRLSLVYRYCRRGQCRSEIDRLIHPMRHGL